MSELRISKEDFKKKCTEATVAVTKELGKGTEDPMASMVLGMTTTVAYAELIKLLFPKQSEGDLS